MFIVVLSFSIPLAVLICAICEVSSALSVGFIGSWFCNCVVSSFRKLACEVAVESFVVELLELVELDEPDAVFAALMAA
ncbi:hypothetical protein GCM10028811_13890 [Uliginosibacterium sediminicola]